MMHIWCIWYIHYNGDIIRRFDLVLAHLLSGISVPLTYLQHICMYLWQIYRDFSVPLTYLCQIERTFNIPLSDLTYLCQIWRTFNVLLTHIQFRVHNGSHSRIMSHPSTRAICSWGTISKKAHMKKCFFFAGKTGLISNLWGIRLCFGPET